MGTVLSFSPRERRPVYSTYHNHGTLSSAGSADYPLNNYSYEQLNNVKNRENSKSSLLQVPNNGNIMLSQTQNNHHHHLHTHTIHNGNNNANIAANAANNNSNLTSNLTNNNITNNNSINNNNNNADRNDTARILSEKNALEKNLKKHSLFINALSWKRLAASHSKKKMDNNKNKAANLPTATFVTRQPLVEAVHPLAIDKNKNIQQQNHHQYFTPGAPNTKALLALDLVRANNTNNAQQHLEKLTTKLPLTIPLQTAFNHAQQQQHQSMLQPAQQHSHVPRKTVIQVIKSKSILTQSREEEENIYESRTTSVYLARNPIKRNNFPKLRQQRTND